MTGGATTIIVLLTVSALCWISFGAVERRVRHPLLLPSYFRAPALSGAVVIAFAGFLALGAFLFFNTHQVAAAFETGLRNGYTVIAVLAVAAAPTAGWAFPRSARDRERGGESVRAAH
jgi:hypothetical protein